jgi:hypothetical protein
MSPKKAAAIVSISVLDRPRFSNQDQSIHPRPRWSAIAPTRKTTKPSTYSEKDIVENPMLSALMIVSTTSISANKRDAPRIEDHTTLDGFCEGMNVSEGFTLVPVSSLQLF